MTLSAPPGQPLRASLARAGDPPSRRAARIAGIFMVITFISIPGLLLYDQVLHHANFVLGAGGGDARVYVGALFEILTLIAGIGMAVTLFPVLRRQSEALALGYVAVRVVESCLIAVGIVSLLRSGLVPRRFAQFGIAGGSLALVTALLVLFGAYSQSSGASFILTLPEAIWELSLGIYLIVNGFTPSHVLYDDGRHAGVDPLIPTLPAPEPAPAR